MRKLIIVQKQDAMEVVKMKNVKTMKLNVLILILKKSILAQINAENQEKLHVEVLIVLLLNLLILKIIVPALMMMILKK